MLTDWPPAEPRQAAGTGSPNHRQPTLPPLAHIHWKHETVKPAKKKEKNTERYQYFLLTGEAIYLKA